MRPSSYLLFPLSIVWACQNFPYKLHESSRIHTVPSFWGRCSRAKHLVLWDLSPPGSPDIQTVKEQAGLITPAAEVQTPFPHSLVPSSTLPSHGSASEALDPALNFRDEAWAVQLKDSFILSYLEKSVTVSLWKCWASHRPYLEGTIAENLCRNRCECSSNYLTAIAWSKHKHDKLQVRRWQWGVGGVCT